ncbi:MAG: P-type conjugative transfer protein TrbG [Rhodospirillales bacterium]|nr:P-type conjugative transfer protein TrbG [Acetobacter sp.]
MMAAKFKFAFLAGTVALALSVNPGAYHACAQQPAPPDVPVEGTPPPLQAPPGVSADLPQPDPTPASTPPVAADSMSPAPPTGQIYPGPAARTTDTPLSPERRTDLVTKQARAEAGRTLNPQEQNGVNMTDQWAAKSDQFQSQSSVNGSVVLTFNSSLPTITAAVLELTDVELQPGEAVTSVNVGDTARWVVSVTNSQEGELQRPHLILKPLDEGLKTSLVITTSKRTYHLLLQSNFDRFMHYVTFTYPEDPEVTALEQKRAADLAALQRTAAHSRAEDQAKLPKPAVPGPAVPTVAYRIQGDAVWQPLYAYTDGVKTYIQMPPTMSQTEAPSLLALRRGKGLWGDDKVIVNYRVQHNRYIVDSVLDRALMVIGRDEVKLTKKIVAPPAPKTTRATVSRTTATTTTRTKAANAK